MSVGNFTIGIHENWISPPHYYDAQSWTQSSSFGPSQQDLLPVIFIFSCNQIWKMRPGRLAQVGGQSEKGFQSVNFVPCHCHCQHDAYYFYQLVQKGHRIQQNSYSDVDSNFTSNVFICLSSPLTSLMFTNSGWLDDAKKYHCKHYFINFDESELKQNQGRRVYYHLRTICHLLDWWRPLLEELSLSKKWEEVLVLSISISHWLHPPGLLARWW